MATTEKYTMGSTTTLITTGGSAANNTSCRGASYDNTQGNGGGDGFVLCEVEFVGSFTVAPSANTAISVWFLATIDGTNYEDGDGSVSNGTTSGSDVTPARLPDLVLPLRTVTGSQRVNRRFVLMPWGVFLPLLKNDGTGQALSSGATLKIRPVTPQGT